jgi:two-component system chemotaxis response regulator CheB
MSRYDLVVIGASWGGMRALETVLGGLPGGFPVPIAVAQHRDPDAEDDLLAHLLSRHTGLALHDADDGDELRPGTALLAPPGYHMLVEDSRVALSVDELVQFARPSIDVLFESASEQHGAKTVGVILTGANADGADGLRAIKRRGGYTIVQDPATAERQEMPRAALAAEPDAVLPLDEIPAALTDLCGLEVGA